MAGPAVPLTQKEAFDLTKKNGSKIRHHSFEDDEFIYFKKADGLWYDNEGDTVLPQQWEGNFFVTGWSVVK